MFEHCRSSEEQNASAVVLAKAGYLCGVQIITDGTNDGTVKVYDHPSAATGGVKVSLFGEGARGGSFVMFEKPLQMSQGIYVALTGTNATFVAYFND